MIIDSTYFVRVEYLNVTDSNTSYPYLLNGCPDVDCLFDIFTNIYKPRLPVSADVECRRRLPPAPPAGKWKLEFNKIIYFYV